jgi:hypothetical protein
LESCAAWNDEQGLRLKVWPWVVYNWTKGWPEKGSSAFVGWHEVRTRSCWTDYLGRRSMALSVSKGAKPSPAGTPAAVVDDPTTPPWN